MNLLPNVVLISGQDEWAKITEVIEHSILPQLEVNGTSFILYPEAISLPPSRTVALAAKHQTPVPRKCVVSQMSFLLKGQAVVLVEGKHKVLKAPIGLFVPKEFQLELHGKVSNQIPHGEWLTFIITTFGAIVTQCRLTSQAHYEGNYYLVVHAGLPALLTGERQPNKVTIMAVLSLLARASPFLPTFWELLPTSFVEMPTAVRQALQFLHHSYNRPLCLSEVANWCHVDHTHLCRLFRQWVGVSPSVYLARLRMSAAWKLLTETKLPPTLIASLVGYSKWSQFSQQFMRTFGMKPTQVRKNVALEPLKFGDFRDTAPN
jgi:AraC-like DNA-binding protein